MKDLHGVPSLSRQVADPESLVHNGGGFNRGWADLPDEGIASHYTGSVGWSPRLDSSAREAGPPDLFAGPPPGPLEGDERIASDCAHTRLQFDEVENFKAIRPKKSEPVAVAQVKLCRIGVAPVEAMHPKLRAEQPIFCGDTLLFGSTQHEKAAVAEEDEFSTGAQYACCLGPLCSADCHPHDRGIQVLAAHGVGWSPAAPGPFPFRRTASEQQYNGTPLKPAESPFAATEASVTLYLGALPDMQPGSAGMTRHPSTPVRDDVRRLLCAVAVLDSPPDEEKAA